jgi:glycosyltransferase involved in cell wall biosynthesis
MTMSDAVAKIDLLGLTWELSSITGWGVYGTNVALEILKRGEPRPVLLKQPSKLSLTLDRARIIGPLLRQQQELHRAMVAGGRPKAMQLDFPVFQTVLPQFKPMVAGRYFHGQPDLAIIFFENTHITDEALTRSNRYARTIAGSTWNHEILAAAGIHGVRTVLQGIDPSLFKPRQEPLGQRNRFVIFSGGKLEHRKGQDIVLSAFRIFNQRHPDSMLMTCWQNPWPDKANDIGDSGLVSGSPTHRNGLLDIAPWAVQQGLPEGSVVDMGFLPNHKMPGLLNQCDCAVFASRFESGTNLPAMEAMACGLPVILSENTGHMDLIKDKNCYPLTRQKPVPSTGADIGNDGWGAAEPEELVEQLEQIYTDREEAQRRGSNGSKFMKTLSWKNQVEKLLNVLAEVS